MNAKIGKYDCKGYSYHDMTNRNGQLLLDLMMACDLIEYQILQTERQAMDFHLTK